MVSLEQAVGFHVADDGFDAVSPAHLAADGARDDTAGVGDHGLQVFAKDTVPAIAAVDIGAADLATCEAGDLVDLGGEAVAIVRVARQGPGDEHELAPGSAGVGDGEGGLHAEFVAVAGLAPGDAFALG